MAMQIISFRCVLRNKFGHIIGSTFNHNVVNAVPSAPSRASNLKALVDGMQNIKKGEKRRIYLRADEAYGFYDPSLVAVRRLDEVKMTEPIELGDVILFVSGGRRNHYRVTELTEDTVTLDANHPLAGQDLVFEVEATEARDATAEEMEELDELDDGDGRRDGNKQVIFC